MSYDPYSNSVNGPMPSDNSPLMYSCADCGHDVELQMGAPVRCSSCGFRILLKKRTRRMVQFEAR